MSRPDATAGAFIQTSQVIRPVHFVFLDFLGDPLRANDSGYTVAVTGMTQPDLNGTYDGVTADFAELSPVKVSEGGSSTVTAKLSGIKGLDDDTLNIIGDQTKWKGRLARAWRLIRDQNHVDQGSFQHYYTGYMVDAVIGGKASEQFIEVTIESYLAAFSQASQRTYQSQKEFDAGDLSGEAGPAVTTGGSGGITGMFGGISRMAYTVATAERQH